MQVSVEKPLEDPKNFQDRKRSIDCIDTDSPDELHKQKSKRNRATWHQKSLLERVFQTTQYPDLALRNQLSEQLGMTPRKVQIWFQNRRTKAKEAEKEISTEKTPEKNSKQEEVPNVDVNIQNKAGNSLLFIASALGHSSVAYLLSRGANVNVTNNAGQTPLFVAIQNGHDEIVKDLLNLKKGENMISINAREFKYGESALHIAALTGSTRSVKLLLSHEETMINTKDYENFTPLHHATVNGHPEIVRLLIGKGADVNAKSSEGFVPLHAAAIEGNPETIEFLIKSGADVEIADSKGFTSLSFAVREGKIEAIKTLINNKANLEAKTNEGMTPLHISCCRTVVKVVKMLVEGGAALNSTNNKKQTPLHLCSLLGYDDVVRYMLEQGADFELKENQGKNASDYATLSENKKTIQIFKDFFGQMIFKREKSEE